MAEINGRCHWRHTDSQTASALAYFLNDLILALIDILKQLLSLRKKNLPLFCQIKALACAVNQRNIQFLFKGFH